LHTYKCQVMALSNFSNDKTANNPNKTALLEAYGFEKTSNDESFNNLLNLAKIICDAPIAYVSIFDDNYQYILAQDGADFQTIPKQDSICQLTLDKKDILVIEDTKKDSRTKNLPFITQNPSIDFYSGSPLIDDENNYLGAFCIMDYSSRKLRVKEEEALNLLNKEVVKLFKSRKKIFSNLKGTENQSSKVCENLEDLEEQIFYSHKNLLSENKQLLAENGELKSANFLLKRKPQELESIIDVLPACISFVDLNYCYQLNNKMYEEWFGVLKTSLKGKHISDIFGKEKFQKLLPYLNRAFKGEVVQFEFTINGEKERHVRTTFLPSKDYSGTIRGTLVFSDDITQLKDYQEQLELSNKSLESFAYIASHDIKSPLKTITSFAKLLQTDLNKNKVIYKSKYLEFIIKSADVLDNLTTHLLSFAKVQNNEVKVETVCSFNEILKIVCTNLQTTITNANATIEFKETDTQLMVYENDLLQLLQNIISNGIKYQTKDNQPIIKISTSQKNGFLKINISDNGIGIKQENFKRIFQPFARLHSNSDYTGTGLGLATCKKIIEKYNSTLEISSVVNKGTINNYDGTLHINKTG